LHGREYTCIIDRHNLPSHSSIDARSRRQRLLTGGLVVFEEHEILQQHKYVYDIDIIIQLTVMLSLVQFRYSVILCVYRFNVLGDLAVSSQNQRRLFISLSCLRLFLLLNVPFLERGRGLQ